MLGNIKSRLTRRITVALALGALVLGVGGGFLTYSLLTVQAAVVPITLSAGTEAQLGVWQLDLQQWLVDNPSATSGEKDYDFVTGQLDFYNLVLGRNGRNLNTNQITTEMWIAMDEVVISYRNAVDYVYNVGSATVSRDELKTQFNDLRVAAGLGDLLAGIEKLVASAEGFGKGNTQYGLSNGNAGCGGGCSEGAGNGNGFWWDELDEGFGAGRGSGSGPDDATTYWSGPTAPSASEGIRTTIGTVLDPVTDLGHIVRTRNKKSASGGQQIDIDVALYETVSTTCDTLRRSSNVGVDIGTTWTTRSITLPSATADAIVDYGALCVETDWDAVGGGSPKAGWESAHEFEVPDAPGGSPRNRVMIISKREGVQIAKPVSVFCSDCISVN